LLEVADCQRMITTMQNTPQAGPVTAPPPPPGRPDPAPRLGQRLAAGAVAAMLLHLTVLVGADGSTQDRARAPGAVAPLDVRLLPDRQAVAADLSAPRVAPAGESAEIRTDAAAGVSPDTAAKASANAVAARPAAATAPPAGPARPKTVDTALAIAARPGTVAQPGISPGPIGSAPGSHSPAIPAMATLAAVEASPASHATEPAASVRPAQALPDASVLEAPAPARGEEPIPSYRTRLPPATTLRYQMRRGMLSGTGDLVWHPEGDHYELRLEARVAGLPVLTQVSTGGFDAAGIAPLRFTDQRLRRAATAANFQRAAGKITFSGPSTEFALRTGAQDRLSWMVQLAAIVSAEPALAKPGARVLMVVVGSHGDADVWAFHCEGAETVVTGVGAVPAIKYSREPRETYDTTVQVWLDPARHGLPVRAVQKSGPSDDGFDLRLQEVPGVP
jgi:hypothetical protein